MYFEALSEIDGVVVPHIADGVDVSWFVFVVRLSEHRSRQDRERVLHALSSAGIGCRDYFQPIHLQPFVRETLGTREGQFPVTEAVADRTIALPFYPQMRAGDVERVAGALRRAVQAL
jgi:perosamine synthetase